MAFYTTLSGMRAGRKVKPIYAKTQATPQAGQLKTVISVFPGMLLSGSINELIRCNTSIKPLGICSSNNYEVQDGDVSLWIPGYDSIISVSDYDKEFDWDSALESLGKVEEVYLGCDENARLTVVEGDNPTASFRLIGMENSNILVAGISEGGIEWDYNKPYEVIGKTLYASKEVGSYQDGIMTLDGKGLIIN